MKVLSSDSYTGEVQLEGLNQRYGRCKGHYISKVPPNPDGSGGHEYIYPYDNSKCLVAEVDGMNFILGFYTAPTVTQKGNRGFSLDTAQSKAPGSYRVETNAHNFIEASANGLVSLFSSAWSALHLDQFTQSLQGKVKRLFATFGGGFIKWDTDEENNSEFEIVINKKFDPYTDARNPLFTESSVPRGDDYPAYADKFIMRVSSEQRHVVEMETRQDIDGDNVGDTLVRTTYGKAENTSHKHEYLQDLNNRIVDKKLLEDGILQHKDYQAGDSHIEEIIRDTGEVSISVNGKAIVNIKPNGEVRIESSDQQIFIGTANRSADYKGLLTTDFIDVFNAHVHAGNMGTMTSKAMYPEYPLYAITQVTTTTNPDQSGQTTDGKKIHTSRLKGN